MKSYQLLWLSMSGSARAVHITTLVKLEVWNVSDGSQTIVNTDSLLIDKKDTGIQLLQMCDYIYFK